MEKLTGSANILTLSLKAIKQNYGQFRLSNVAGQDRLTQSMAQYGQISPVVVCPAAKDGEFEIIDGFKRLRAARQLEFKNIKATLLEVGIHARKAAIIQLNWMKHTVKPFEEALVLHSLFHDDGLSQVEICRLLNRHKSWVSRRISLVERLCDEVQEQIKLGLVSVSVGRELAKLPRGNQESALNTIQKYAFCCRETERLVILLLSNPKWEGEAILNYPGIILDDRVAPKPPRVSKKKKTNKVVQLEKKLTGLSALCSTIAPMIDAVKSNDNIDSEKDRLKKLATHLIEQVKSSLLILEDFKLFLDAPPF